MRRRNAFTVIELLVAGSIFILVGLVCWMLLRAALVTFVWGSKRMDCLRQNREITRRLAPIIRGGVSAVQGGTPVVRVTTVAIPPVPANHVEELVLSTTVEFADEVLQRPVPAYPAAGAFDPRSGNPAALFQNIRVFWDGDSQVLAVDADTPGDNSDDIVISRNVELVDFATFDPDRSVSVLVTTRSQDQNTRADTRPFTTRIMFNIPSWQQ